MPLDGTKWPEISEQVQKLDRVSDLLSDESRWCKRALRDGVGRRCLLGAMMAAEAGGLREPILAAIRDVTGRNYDRIELFNDHPRTDFAQIGAVLARARERLLLGEAHKAAPKRGWFKRALALLA